jgi:hypothetical protein
MKPLYAILTTIVLFTLFYMLDLLGLGIWPCIFLQLLLAIWVYMDAKVIEMKNYKLGFGPSGPLSAFILVLLFWFVFFPWYLINKRRVLRMKEAQMEADFPAIRQITEKDMEALENLHAMRKSGSITETEYAREKESILQGRNKLR